MLIGIIVENPTEHVHTQNGLIDSFIKWLQLIARPLLMKPNLPTSAWGHAIFHASTLIHIMPTSYHTSYPLQLVFRKEPNISHLKTFGCVVYVPIASPKHSKMGPHRRFRIYVRHESLSIINILNINHGHIYSKVC
jgi:hypothetical protein